MPPTGSGDGKRLLPVIVRIHFLVMIRQQLFLVLDLDETEVSVLISIVHNNRHRIFPDYSNQNYVKFLHISFRIFS